MLNSPAVCACPAGTTTLPQQRKHLPKENTFPINDCSVVIMFEVAVPMCDLKRRWDGNFGTSEVVGGKTPHCLGEFHWRQGN